MINSISEVASLKSKSVKIDINGALKTCTCAGVKNGVINCGQPYVYDDCSLPTGVRIKKGYLIENEIYVYATNGYIYKKSGESFEKISTSYFTTIPKLVMITFNGEKKILVITPNTQKVLGATETSVSIPDCDCAIEDKGILFVGKDNSIFFSGEYDYVSGSSGVVMTNQIRVEKNAGKVLAINQIKDELYVICKHKIYLLQAYGEPAEYKLNLVDTNYLNIEQDSVAGNSHRLFFIQDKSIYSFDGKSVKNHKSFLEQSFLTKRDCACFFEEKYVIPVYVSGENSKYVYCYCSEQEQFVSISDNLVILDGGYAISSLDGRVYLLKQNTGGINSKICFEPNNLGENAPKAITSFWICVKGYANLKITGDNGVSATYKLVNGINYRRIYFEANTFTFELSGTYSNMEINDFSITYAIRGRK